MHMEGGAKATLSHSARIRLLLSHSGLYPAVSFDPGEFSAKGPTLPHLQSSSVCWALPGCHSSYSRTPQWTGSPTNCSVRHCAHVVLGNLGSTSTLMCADCMMIVFLIADPQAATRDTSDPHSNASRILPSTASADSNVSETPSDARVCKHLLSWKSFNCVTKSWTWSPPAHVL